MLNDEGKEINGKIIEIYKKVQGLLSQEKNEEAKLTLYNKAIELLKNCENKQVKKYTEHDYKFYLEKKNSEIPTGFYRINEYAKLPVGEITLIGALSSHGKSAFMRQLALNIVMENKVKKDEDKIKVAFFPYETESGKTVTQFNCMRYNLKAQSNDGLKIKFSEYDKRCRNQMDSLYAENWNMFDKNSDIIINDKRYPPDDLMLVVKKLVEEDNKIKVVFIDYLQIIPPDANTLENANRYLQLAYMMRVLLDIAINNNVAIVTGAQFREVDHAKEKKDIIQPRHVREGKDIYFFSNLFFGLWNQTAYDADNNNLDISKDDYHAFEVDILKNRDNPKKRGIQFDFLAPYLIFNEK